MPTINPTPQHRDIPAQQARSLVVERAAIDAQARTATLAFASETPYERYWGVEILDCTATAMRTGRLQTGANLLCDHNGRDVVGVVESVQIGPDRVGRAVVRFGKSARAEEVWQDVIDGIRRNVSVGYMIHKAQLVETVEGQDTYRVTDWEPFEISLVAIPADPTVGVGRSVQERPPEAAALVRIAAAGTPPATETETPPTPSPASSKGTLTMTDRNHAIEIAAIGATIAGGHELALKSIQAGHTVEQFQAELVRHLASKPVPSTDIGMSRREVQRYSLLRAMNALANPTDQASRNLAAFEFEASAAVGKIMGREARGIFLPTDVQKRDLVAGTNSAGGFSVATELRGFIDILRNALVLNKAGAQFLSGLVGNIAIPKLSGSGTAYWVAENGAPTESQQTLAQVTMAPKTLAAFTDISRRLLLQSSLDVEQMVTGDLAKIVAIAMQQAAINGTGASNQPSGILTQVTPSVVGGINGAAPSWANIVALETAVAVANADVSTMGYLTNAKVRGKLKGTEKFPGTNGQPVYADGNLPLNGYAGYITNAVPSNLTKGTSSGVCSALIFGNFSDLIVGLWGATDILVDPYTGGAAGTVRVRVMQDCDVAVRNVESFATMADALTV